MVAIEKWGVVCEQAREKVRWDENCTYEKRSVRETTLEMRVAAVSFEARRVSFACAVGRWVGEIRKERV